MTAIRCRLDGKLEGVRGPICDTAIDRASIAGTMGWQDSGEAGPIITVTLDLLTQGKAVKLTSHYGWCEFQPLLDSEDGRNIPASWCPLYAPDGRVIRSKA